MVLQNNFIEKVIQLVGQCKAIKDLKGEQSAENNWYRTTFIPKNSGGYRRIDAPPDELKFLQNRIINVIFKDGHLSAGRFAHGSVIGKSAVTNAICHANPRVYIHMDIQNCFFSSNWAVKQSFTDTVHDMFTKHISWNNMTAEQAAEYIAYVCFSFDGKYYFLPQGAPTSPYIVNLYLSPFDAVLNSLLKKESESLRYTRYVDDIAITSQSFIPKDMITRIIGITENMLHSKKYNVKWGKTRVYSTKGRIAITGITINKKFNSLRKYRRILRAQLCNATKVSEKEFNKLQGKVAWVENIYKANKSPYPNSLQQIKKDLLRLKVL